MIPANIRKMAEDFVREWDNYSFEPDDDTDSKVALVLARFIAELPASPLEARKIEIRTNANATLDEAILRDGTAHFHLEQMNATHWWMELLLDQQAVHINLHSKATITASISDEGEVPLLIDVNGQLMNNGGQKP